MGVLITAVDRGPRSPALGPYSLVPIPLKWAIFPGVWRQTCARLLLAAVVVAVAVAVAPALTLSARGLPSPCCDCCTLHRRSLHHGCPNLIRPAPGRDGSTWCQRWEECASKVPASPWRCCWLSPQSVSPRSSRYSLPVWLVLHRLRQQHLPHSV
jgi:hypothetical protein